MTPFRDIALILMGFALMLFTCAWVTILPTLGLLWTLGVLK